jgi:hypothetical protein
VVQRLIIAFGMSRWRDGYVSYVFLSGQLSGRNSQILLWKNGRVVVCIDGRMQKFPGRPMGLCLGGEWCLGGWHTPPGPFTIDERNNAPGLGEGGRMAGTDEETVPATAFEFVASTISWRMVAISMHDHAECAPMIAHNARNRATRPRNLPP